jgi:hypothetical protein
MGSFHAHYDAREGLWFQIIGVPSLRSLRQIVAPGAKPDGVLRRRMAIMIESAEHARRPLVDKKRTADKSVAQL